MGLAHTVDTAQRLSSQRLTNIFIAIRYCYGADLAVKFMVFTTGAEFIRPDKIG
jgi:hypothetical protein